MPVTIIFHAPDGLKSIVVERNRLWENARISFNGEVIKTCNYAYETREGIEFDVEGLGIVTLKVHSATLKPTLKVNGVEYSVENQSRNKGKLLVPAIIFGVLAIINTIFFFIALSRYLQFPDWPFAIFTLFVSAFFMLSYIATTILIGLRIYFFYFAGTAIFIFSTIYIALMLYLNGINWIFLTLFIGRVLVLALLSRYFKRALGLLRNRRNYSNENQIIDERL